MVRPAFTAKNGSTHKSEIEAIRKLIQAIGGWCYVLHQVGRLRGSAGIPDIYCHVTAIEHRFWVEVKVGRDKLRDAQMEFRFFERACGGSVVVGGVEEVIQHLKAHGMEVKSW